MINLGVVFGIARAEARLTRRLVRFWIFAIISMLIGVGAYMQWWVIHRFASFLSASAAAINPRYFVGNFGSNFLLIFIIGIVFLAFDVRARDRRERMEEVTDSLPFSNVELVLGRALGIFLPAWGVAVFIALFLSFLGWSIGGPVEPRSMINFIVFMSIPAFVFTIGMVYFLTLLLRHRLVASITALAIIVLAFFGTLWWIPLYYTPLMDVSGGFTMPFPSDIVGEIVNSLHFVQRLGFLLAGLGLLWLAAAIHPRIDDGSRSVRAATGGALVLSGVALLFVQVVQADGILERKASWSEAHRQRQSDPAPDMQAIRGQLRVDPGSRLEMALDLRFEAPQGQTLNAALFSLNPGLEVEEVTGAAGGLDHSFEDGLLEIQLASPLPPGVATSVQLKLRGEPSPDFAYLDSAIEMLELKPVDAQIALLGYDPLVFDKRFVALLPGIRWLPASGAEIGRADARIRPSDFYTIDLEVDVPEGWLVAGPGRRQEAAGAEAGRVRYRFAPQAHVPDFAVIAAPFESRSTEIGGVVLEALVHRSHLRNVEVFDEASAEIEQWLEERLADAAGMGLGYPYDALTLVEVPVNLRGFAGGWRMDTTFAQPAMILMRESTFPTARFDVPYKNRERYEDREGGIARAKREGLERFFESDFNGGNPFLAASRSFFGFQTAGAGAEGVPLDFVWETLTTRLLTDKSGYFSVHLFDQQVGETFQAAGQEMRSPDRVAESFADVMIHMMTSRAEVWETLLDVSLSGLDPWEDPERTINVLSLKGGAMAQSLMDYLGREKAGEFLATLRSRNVGGSFTRQDVIDAGNEVGVDLSLWLDTWIDGTDLPGFVIADVSASRVSDDEDGTPQYQTLITVVNEEDTAGLLRFDYRAGIDDDEERGSSDPVYVPARSAVEVGLVSSKTPRTLRAYPYLSLNREAFSVPLPPLDEERIVEAEPFLGIREVSWTPAETEAIVVDDLDSGFEVADATSRSKFRVGGAVDSSIVLDQGLPVNEAVDGTPSRWSRRTASHAFGKYRHTMALVRSGSGERQAVFSTAIPRSGEWELEFHLPKRADDSGSRGPKGKWKLHVVDASGDQEVEFDAGSGAPGWNLLGRFEIASGQVRVELSDETDGRYVVADAVRWTPVARTEVARSSLP